MGFKGLKIEELIRAMHVGKTVLKAGSPGPLTLGVQGTRRWEQPWGRSKAGGTVTPELEGPGGKEGSGSFQKKVWEMKFGLCGRGL